MGESLNGRLDPQLIERFARDLNSLVDGGKKVGVAVSGGPDSAALLLLATAARPGLVEAATVDHSLRPESRDEAAFVARLSASLGIPHRILTVQWDEAPRTAVQERAREKRYSLLSAWADERGLTAVLTGHHRDDQAETLLMRLRRGAGVTGLAGMRPVSPLGGGDIQLVRPLLGWSHSELVAICAAAGVRAVSDPSNDDEQFERVRLRKAVADAEWLDPVSLAASAAHLADADEVLAWAVEAEWDRSVTASADAIIYTPTEAPAEIHRRIVSRAILLLASEGDDQLRGREIDRVMTALISAQTVTLRGVRCAGGTEWRFTRAPKRRG